jgi:DNA polymerase-3 subunit alpha
VHLGDEWKIRPEEDLLIELQGWLGSDKAKWVLA